MKKNNEHIHINHVFIESDSTTFAAKYDISLVRFMFMYKYNQFGEFEHNMDPKEIVEVEKEFIKTTLYFLKIRYREICSYLDKIRLQFLEENKLTQDQLDEGHDSDLGKKFEDYEYKKLPREVWDEYSSFRMKINLLLVKANKIGCLIDLKADFKLEESLDYTDESDLHFDAKGSEKLVYLKETGIIGFLKEQNPDLAESKIAKLLSIITGERHLQPGLNAMETDSPHKDRKNPYFSPKTAPKVKNQLIQWGFKIKNIN
jgi:hypothetical protein